MKIAFVCLYEAYPPASGAAYVTYNCAHLMPGTSLLVQLARRSGTTTVDNLTIVSLPQRSPSRMAKLAWFPLTIITIQRAIARFTPDIVVLEGASWVVYLALIVLAIRKTLPKVKVVYHAHNVEYLLRQERNSPSVVALTKRAERYLLTNCDRSFAVSNEDRQHFFSLYGILPSLLPNGVDCSAYMVPRDAIDAARKRFAITDESILFMGLYGYPPNTEAVRFLAKEVMPRLHLQRPNLRLVVTGGGPPTCPPWLISTGVLSRSDLNAVICACRIGVAPIFKGSGTRLKILEYIAAGLPVVTTRKGAEGLNLDAGTHALYAETASEFQHALLKLLDDSSLSKNISEQARGYIQSTFDWTTLLCRFANDLETP
ncbi:MAG TPA: glycosyltransferase family 4 protein [Terracidiphilus sp.]|nr:glycosyltransferase family 4 protein [Terracidiphilus sp.]